MHMPIVMKREGVCIPLLRRISYFIMLAVVVCCGVYSVQLSLAAFQMSVLGHHTSTMPWISAYISTTPLYAEVVRPGTLAYWKLERVQKALIFDAQSAAIDLQASLGRFSLLPLASEGSIARAVIVYLPPISEQFQRQFKAMYLSLAYMRTFQKSTIKTDYVVYTPGGKPSITLLKSMGCSEQVRLSFEDPERCVVLPFVPIAERRNVTEPLNDYARFVDSVSIMAEFDLSETYQYVLKTDLDTLLPPGFANWILPKDIAIATGRGAYGSTYSNHHLKWTATEALGLKESGAKDVGTTWYGVSAVLRDAARVSMAAMRWLDSQDFSVYEKQYSDFDGIPHWHHGVLSMFGGQKAINQIPSELRMAPQPQIMEMDFDSTNSVSPIPEYVKHIHCWYRDAFFSKTKFDSGAYNSLDLTQYKEMNSSAAYAGVITISADRMTWSELGKYASDADSMKAKAWLRIFPKN